MPLPVSDFRDYLLLTSDYVWLSLTVSEI